MDARLTRLSKICLALPETVRQDCGRHAGFLVRKKTFVWFLDDHHGDGIVGVSAKVLPGDNSALVAAHPARFTRPRTCTRRAGWGCGWIREKWTGTKWLKSSPPATG
jgi:hypothetical protein